MADEFYEFGANFQPLQYGNISKINIRTLVCIKILHILTLQRNYTVFVKLGFSTV